ncbi:MAG TPA: hypothetical protein VKS78_16405 [Roseiarcus sp.]|nr:hypothetical protein [Roseiarcus sp.]
MASPAYLLFRDAIVGLRPIACHYQGLYRELCPHILGHTKGEEVALAYQFAGESRSGLLPGGEWKCLHLAKVANAEFRDGPWRTGASHTRFQSCVQIVDFDVNPASPYKPRSGRGR